MVLLTSVNAGAAAITVEKFDDSDNHYVFYDGPVQELDAVLLENILTDDRVGPGSVLRLNSPGGRGDIMIELMEVIKAAELKTVVREGDGCYSACANMWLAGKERFTVGEYTLGFHMPSFTAESAVQISQAYGALGLQDIVKDITTESIQLYTEETYFDLKERNAFVLEILIKGPKSETFYMPTREELDQLVGNVVHIDG